LTVNIADVNVMLDIEDVCELCMPTSKMSGVMLDAFGISSKHSVALRWTSETSAVSSRLRRPRLLTSKIEQGIFDTSNRKSSASIPFKIKLR